MQILRERILRDGRHLGNNILKVDSSMNHQIDSHLMRQIGEEFARRFANSKATRILTVESSGIAPALATGMAMNLPIVFARKQQPITMAADPYKESAPSHTKGGIVDIIVSSEYLTDKDRVLILDDFLSTAKTLHALIKLVNASGAALVGIGAVIEKTFEGGRASLKDVGVPIESLARIERFDGDKIIFTEQEALR
jgi:xanthine phosphoribosyltransferase